MTLHPVLSRVAKIMKRLMLRRPDDPHEYAMVGARVRPKQPTLSAKAAAVPEAE